MKFDQSKELKPQYEIAFTGMYDIDTAHVYNREFYEKHCPEVEYIEIDRDDSQTNSELSNFWGEQVGGLKVSRRVNVRAFPQFTEAPSQYHRKHAVEIDHDVVFDLGVGILKDLDLWPEMGDHISYMGFDYEIIRVRIDPERLWLHTNSPLHVSLDAVVYRPGDSKFEEGGNRI